MRAAEMQAEELKYFTQLEVKGIDLGKIYKEGVKTWAKRHAARLVENITESTRRFLQRVLNRGVEEGKSNKEIAKDIRAKMTGPAAARRAFTIARTETHTATQKGSYETAAQSGLDMEKEWGATEDDRTRLSHSLADGQVVALDELFAVGGVFMAYPGDPTGPAKEVINCRCVALYWPKGLRS
ncbi:MAG: hypothetical protein CGW95_01195 [Phenylobacterium zucineum]|nr:MAG: hypothetical protein CGW95_01195 [Phenylobacterium zucineum]